RPALRRPKNVLQSASWRCRAKTQAESNGDSSSGGSSSDRVSSSSSWLLRSIQLNGTANVENGGTLMRVGFRLTWVASAFLMLWYGCTNSRSHSVSFMNAPESALHGGS